MKYKSFSRYLFLSSIAIATFLMFSASDEPVIGILKGTSIESYLLVLNYRNSIIFNLSVGYLVSILLWLIVVYYPSKQHRLIIQKNLNDRYIDFRKNTIGILLFASTGKYDLNLLDTLCDHQKFKEYFSANKNEKWFSALNHLQQNMNMVDDLLVEFQIFSSEITYVLNNIEIRNQKVHSVFKQFNEHIYRLKNSSVYSEEQVKHLGSFLFSIHARWSFIEGQLEADAIQEMIDNL